MEKNIYSVAELVNLGKKFARLVDNRDFDTKDLNAKKASLKAKGQLIPAIVVDGKKAVDEGLEIVDFEKGETITDPTNYLVIIEGNHRYKAYLELKKDNTNEQKYEKDFYVMYPLNDSDSIDSMFKEMNISTNPWKSKDYLKEVARKTEYPLLKEIDELVKQGYSLPSASMWLTLGKPLSSTTIKNLSAGKKPSDTNKTYLETVSNIKLGKELIDLSVRAFNTDFVKSRLLATWVTGKICNKGIMDSKETIDRIKQMLERLATNDKEIADKIVQAKKDDRKDDEDKESFVKRMLNEQFELKAE